MCVDPAMCHQLGRVGISLFSSHKVLYRGKLVICSYERLLKVYRTSLRMCSVYLLFFVLPGLVADELEAGNVVGGRQKIKERGPSS